MKRHRQIYRKLKPLGEAKEIFFTRFKDLLMEPEIVPVREALGRVLTGPVKAARSVPAYHGAAMDGVAVRAAATFGALPEHPVSMSAGTEAIPVNTGAPLPEGTDAVVMIEQVESGDGCFEIREAAYPWQNVRKTGEDIVVGEILLPARHRTARMTRAPSSRPGYSRRKSFKSRACSSSRPAVRSCCLKRQRTRCSQD